MKIAVIINVIMNLMVDYGSIYLNWNMDDSSATSTIDYGLIALLKTLAKTYQASWRPQCDWLAESES